MTGQMVYETACAILFEKPGLDKTFYNSAVKLINLLIAEALPYQNNRERSSGRKETEFFQISDLISEIPMDFPIVKIALPYGLASYFFQDEEDNFRAQDYRGRFITALDDAKMCEMLNIIDVYKSGDL